MLPSIWTVYDSPTDYPGKIVARLFVGDSEGYKPSDTIIITDNLDIMREIMLTQMYLTCINRQPDDDPKIVEVWL